MTEGCPPVYDGTIYYRKERMYYDSLYGLGLVGCYCSGYVSSGNRLRAWHRRRSVSAHLYRV